MKSRDLDPTVERDFSTRRGLGRNDESFYGLVMDTLGLVVRVSPRYPHPPLVIVERHGTLHGERMKKKSYFQHTAHRDPPSRFFFQTIGNPTRWTIIQFLRRGPQPVHAICRTLHIEQSRCSHNLRRLERCGFVTTTASGRERVYALNSKTVGPLLRLVDQHIRAFCARTCCPPRRR